MVPSGSTASEHHGASQWQHLALLRPQFPGVVRTPHHHAWFGEPRHHRQQHTGSATANETERVRWADGSRQNCPDIFGGGGADSASNVQNGRTVATATAAAAGIARCSMREPLKAKRCILYPVDADILICVSRIELVVCS